MRKTHSFKEGLCIIAVTNSNRPVTSKQKSRTRWNTVAAIFKPMVWSDLSTVTLVLFIALSVRCKLKIDLNIKVEARASIMNDHAYQYLIERTYLF